MLPSALPASTEIELKAGLPARSRTEIGRALATRCGRPGRVTRLLTIYHDAPDRRLLHAGLALRMRHDGHGWRMSVKADRVTEGGMQRALEVEAPARGPRPDLRRVSDPVLRERVAALLGDVEPEPLFETRVTRTSWTVSAGHGLVEVALDCGAIRAGSRRLPVSEIELELVAGSPEAVFDLAAELLQSVPADLAVASKADRGLALAEGADDPWLPPLPEPDPDMPAADQFARLLAVLAAQISGRLVQTLTESDPEGPHQLRVALRRLRAALWLYRPLLRRRVARGLAAEARAIGQILSPLRDADVLVGGLLHPRLGETDSELAGALDHWHRAVRSRVRRSLRRQKVMGFVIRLHRMVALGGWERGGRRARERGAGPAGCLAAPRLDRLWEEQKAAGDRLASLDPEARHEFRKQMKKLRYAIEFSAPPAARKPFLQACKRLQESLGELNDQAVLDGFRPELRSPELAARLDAALAEIRSTQRVSDLALGRACRHWQALARITPPWREERPRLRQPRAAPHR